MLQTIEVEIDTSGRIHPLEPLSFVPTGRAYLTLLPANPQPCSDDRRWSRIQHSHDAAP